MILKQILDYLERHDLAGLSEIAGACGSSPDAVRSMLETLQRKRLVHRYQAPQGCGSSCRQCAQADAELYRWGAAPDAQTSVDVCSLAPQTIDFSAR